MKRMDCDGAKPHPDKAPGRPRMQSFVDAVVQPAHELLAMRTQPGDQIFRLDEIAVLLKAGRGLVDGQVARERVDRSTNGAAGVIVIERTTRAL